MSKITQMDYLVMNLGVKARGCTPCSVYSKIAFGVQTFHLFVYDEERHMTSTIGEMVDWYWRENSWHYSSWKNIVDSFTDDGYAIVDYAKDERSVYLNEEFIGKVFELAFYFDSVEDFDLTSLEDFKEFK